MQCNPLIKVQQSIVDGCEKRKRRKTVRKLCRVACRELVLVVAMMIIKDKNRWKEDRLALPLNLNRKPILAITYSKDDCARIIGLKEWLGLFYNMSLLYQNKFLFLKMWKKNQLVYL